MSEISLSYTPPLLDSIYLCVVCCCCEDFVDRGWCFARILLHHWFLFIKFKSLHPNVCDRRHDLVNRCINSVSQMIKDMLLICSHNSVLLPSSVPHYQIFNKCFTTVTTIGAGTAYPSVIPNFMHGCLIGSSCLNRRSYSTCYFNLSFSTRQCVVCSLIFGSCLPHWCIQVFRFPTTNGATICFYLSKDTTYPR